MEYKVINQRSTDRFITTHLQSTTAETARGRQPDFDATWIALGNTVKLFLGDSAEFGMHLSAIHFQTFPPCRPGLCLSMRCASSQTVQCGTSAVDVMLHGWGTLNQHRLSDLRLMGWCMVTVGGFTKASKRMDAGWNKLFHHWRRFWWLMAGGLGALLLTAGGWLHLAPAFWRLSLNAWLLGIHQN